MVIPPNDQDTNKYFKSLNELNKSLALNENKFSNIKVSNLNIKNLTSDLGIFVLEK